MKLMKIKKDQNGTFRISHVGIELPGAYTAYEVANLAFKLPDEILLQLSDNSHKKTGKYQGIITYKDVALVLASETA